MKRYLLFVAGALCLGMTMTTNTSAQTTATVYGCYHKSDGHLRRVVSPTECRKEEIAIAWNIQGPKGEKGDTGVQGPPGPQGLKGDTGPQGTPGVQGAKGEKGDSGVQGQQGTPGLTGDKGDTGSPGTKGDKGDAGATGASGPAGPAGPQGIQGEVGPQGPKGDKGEEGAPGKGGGFNGMKEFVEPGTYEFVVPQDVTHVMLEMWGAGGGGGASSHIGGGGGGGGGSGAYTRTLIAVIPGSTYYLTVGVAGAAGVDGAGQDCLIGPCALGRDGGSTTFAGSNLVPLASAPGGSGGTGGVKQVLIEEGVYIPAASTDGGAGGLASQLGEAIRRAGVKGSDGQTVDFAEFFRGGMGAGPVVPALGLDAGKGGNGGSAGYFGDGGVPQDPAASGRNGYVIVTW